MVCFFECIIASKRRELQRYTKLSCFLPWVAAQYDMDYTPGDEEDPDCSKGNGDITEVTAEVCRTNPFAAFWDYKLNLEPPCIFPFTLNGQLNDGCILDDIHILNICYSMNIRLALLNS